MQRQTCTEGRPCEDTQGTIPCDDRLERCAYQPRTPRMAITRSQEKHRTDSRLEASREHALRTP